MRNSTEQRRLLAVVVADIVSYSRLMAENEADTFYRLKDLQSSLITPAIERNHGHIVKWTGDGFLASFDSAVDAVRASVEIQSGNAAAGAGAPDDKRIRFRIGINTGDVIVVPGDVYGDTVNVAARLETAAAPGGICISRSVRDAVRGKFSVEFQDRGELAVKNIPDPVGAFDVHFDPIAWTITREESSARFGRSAYLVAAILALIVGAGTIAAGYFWRRAAVETPKPFAGAPAIPGSPLHEELLVRVSAASPGLSAKARAELTQSYEQSSPHKALVVSVDPAGHWRSTGRPTTENAEEAALENCQVFFAHPCILIATDNTVQTAPVDTNWPRHDMPRVGYTGTFDPEEIPGILPSIRERADIVNYRAVSGPKAIALTPSGGRVFTTSGPNQRAAEEEALRNCNATPVGSREGADCYLYASGNRVVLTLRLTAPLSPAEPPPAQLSTVPGPAVAPVSPAPPPAQPATVSPAGSALHAALSNRLAVVLPGMATRLRDEVVSRYEQARGSKAQAASLAPLGVWRSTERPSAENAETSALENCQVAYGQPCILVAVNDTLPPTPPDNTWPPRDMPRVHYAGLFDPEQIPGTTPELPRRADILSYREATGPKAVAFSPNGGHVYVITGAPNQHAAEEEALKTCYAGGDKPVCFLYASGDQVVLPHRLKEPPTAAKQN